MTRLKSTGFSTRAQFTGAIDEIAQLQTKLRLLTAKRDKALQRVQEEYGPDIDQATLHMEQRLTLCEAYATANRDDVIPAGRQTGETEMATFGFRQHPPALKTLNRKWTMDAVIEAVKRAFGADRFVKTEEILVKEAIKAQLTEEQLASVGLRVEIRETFGVTPKVEDAVTEKAEN